MEQSIHFCTHLVALVCHCGIQAVTNSCEHLFLWLETKVSNCCSFPLQLGEAADVIEDVLQFGIDIVIENAVLLKSQLSVRLGCPNGKEGDDQEDCAPIC